MLIIRDTSALGAFAGVLGTIPQIIFSYLSFLIGYSKYHPFQVSAGIYLYKVLTDDPLGLLLGGLVWLLLSAVLGIFVVVFMRFTGRDYWWIKGLIVSNVVMYVLMYGFIYTLGGSRVVPFDIPTNITIFFSNLIFGLTTAYLIVRFGHKDIISP